MPHVSWSRPSTCWSSVPKRKWAKAGSPTVYVAAQLPLPWEPYPYWFDTVVRLGKLQLDDMVQAKDICGVWRPVCVGDWVVIERGRYDPATVDVWVIADEDFVKLFKENQDVD